MRRKYIGMKRIGKAITVVCWCSKLNCVEQLLPIRLAIEKTHTSPVTSSHLNRVIKKERERERDTHIERLVVAVSKDVLSFDMHYLRTELAEVRIKQKKKKRRMCQVN